MHLLKTLPILALSLLAVAPAHNTAMRELVCRGKPGIDLKITGKPSPDNPKMVRMTLRYTAGTHIGPEYQNLQPGNCSWNPGNFSSVPRESGVVYFDILPEAQPWFANYKRQMDTTSDAGAFFPDTISLPRYLAKSDRYWKFFVDDQTNISISFGSYRNPNPLPTYVTLDGPIGKPAPTVAELRCRGGGDRTLFFGHREAAGDNKVIMSLSYRSAGLEAGPEAKGLTPGTCSWVKRAGIPREPGRIDFVTAANAQLVQARTGGTVDKSPNAAARFPDANTIPIYMQDPAHYWNFNVATDQLMSARAHAAWRPEIGVHERTAETPTERSNPQTVGNRERTAGTSTTSGVTKVMDPPLIFQEMVRQPTLYWMRFSARANSSPTVEFSDAPPVRANGRLGFAKGTPLTVSQRPPANYTAEFVTAPLKLPVNSTYYFVINVPKGPDGQSAKEYSGQFNTMMQTAVVHFTRIDVLNDSDKNSDGDLDFRFFIARAPDTYPKCGTGDPCNERIENKSWATHSSNPIDITMTLERVPDKLRVWVAGADDDGGPGYAARTRSDTRYGSSGASAYTYDRNTASGEFNVGAFPEKPTIRMPFKLRSVDGSVFMFEVMGEIEVNRR